MYTRVSSAGQVDGSSLRVQEASCAEEVQRRGWTLVASCTDPGVSGADRHRPGLLRLMELVKTGSVDAILVTKMDRLGRSLLHLLEVLGQLNESDVKLITVDEPSDWSTGAGRLSMQILGSIAEFERSRIQERVHSGLLTRVRNGGFVGSRAPFGYRAVADPTGKGLILEIDQDAAQWVRTAFHFLIEEGVSIAETARRMDRQGMRSPGGGRLTTSSLREWAVGSGPKTCGGTWSWGAATALIPAILAKHEAELWAEWTMSRPRSTPTSHGSYLLSGLVDTPCGRKYSGRTCTGQASTYVCRNRMSLRPTDPERCGCRSISVDHLNSVVWDRFVETVLTHASAIWSDRVEAHGHRGRLLADVRKLRTQIASEYRDAVDDGFDPQG